MKIDLHCHSYHSDDGVYSPERIIKTAKEKGLDGIALTDHNTTSGWPEAIEAAKKHGLLLILGEELKIKKNGRTIGEMIGYFLKQEINPKGKTVEQIIEEIKKQGGLAIIVHPFYWRKPFKELEKYKNLVDGIEVFNSRSQTKNGNKKALEFAKSNNLVMTAGSDTHSCFEVGQAYIEVDANDLEGIRKAILEKKVKIIGRQSPIYVQIFATIGKIMHLFWKPKAFKK